MKVTTFELIGIVGNKVNALESGMRSPVVVWTQWDDLKLPDGVERCATDGIYPSDSDLSRITFFVPRYMGGKDSVRDLTKMTSLEVLQSPNAGVDDLIPIRPAGVTLCNAAGVHDDSTAELAVGLAIAARRGFARFAAAQQREIWDHQRMATLTDAKVGIVGYGQIGKRISELLAPFKTSVTAFTRSGSDGSLLISEFDTHLPSFDVVILIVPLTDETSGFFNDARFAAMKDGAALINVARGPVVDTDALVKHLQSGRISAGVDVTDPEPLPAGHPLWACPNLIITPHVGGDSLAFVPRGRKLIEEQIARHAKGEALINVIARG